MNGGQINKKKLNNGKLNKIKLTNLPLDKKKKNENKIEFYVCVIL